MGCCCIAQGTQLGVLWWPRGVGWGWVRGSRGRGYRYAYNWFTLLYSRNQHNFVKQLYSNNNNNKRIQWCSLCAHFNFLLLQQVFIREERQKKIVWRDIYIYLMVNYVVIKFLPFSMCVCVVLIMPNPAAPWTIVH